MVFEKMKAFLAEWVPKIDQELYSFLEAKLEAQEDEFNRRIVGEILRFCRAGGKRVRPTLVIAGYLGSGAEPDNRIVRASISYELLHAYLLIHDDIMDRDELRRGQPTIWKSLMEKNDISFHEAFSLAVCAGDIAETYSSEALLRAGFSPDIETRAVNHMHQVIERTGYGQVLDISLEMLPLEKVREEDVLRVHELKTAKYTIEGPLHLGAILAGAEDKVLRAYSEYAVPVGIAFQLQDDVIGVFGDEKKTGKPVGSDIREGKRTLLVVKAYEWGTPEQRKIIEAILGRHNATPEEIETIREIIVETGSLDYSKEMMERLVNEGKAALENAPIREDIKKFLTDLADYVVKREK